VFPVGSPDVNEYLVGLAKSELSLTRKAAAVMLFVVPFPTLFGFILPSNVMVNEVLLTKLLRVEFSVLTDGEARVLTLADEEVTLGIVMFGLLLVNETTNR
jgi:hypothetical protein